MSLWPAAITAILDRLAEASAIGTGVCAGALFIPFPPLRALVAPFDGFFAFGLLVCGTTLAVVGIKAAFARLTKEPAEGRPRSDDALFQLLKSLNQQERSLLGEFVRRGQRTLTLSAALPELRSLLDAELIDCRDRDSLVGGPFDLPFTIRPDVWDFLQARNPAPGPRPPDPPSG